jgi:hypothetical protein
MATTKFVNRTRKIINKSLFHKIAAHHKRPICAAQHDRRECNKKSPCLAHAKQLAITKIVSYPAMSDWREQILKLLIGWLVN